MRKKFSAKNGDGAKGKANPGHQRQLRRNRPKLKTGGSRRLAGGQSSPTKEALADFHGLNGGG
jgi:hypothetical protein